MILTQQVQCEGCGKNTPGYDIVSYGSLDRGCRNLCSYCFNSEVAKQNGLADFENVRFQPIGMIDCDGETHQFHFQTRLLGSMVSLDAFELRDGVPSGYNFQTIGAPGDDLLVLLVKLIEKMRRTLSVKYIADTQNGLQVINQLVCGRIDWDATGEDSMPLMVVDGREITWDDFGRMLMAFEGWQFKLEILDRSE